MHTATNTQTVKVVILDDDVYFNKLLTKYVHNICSHSVYRDLDFEIEAYSDAETCIQKLDEGVDIVLLDFLLNTTIEGKEITGLEVLRIVQEINPEAIVIIVSSQTNMLHTVELMKNGIYDYVNKSINSRQRIGSLLQQIIKENYQTINS